MENVATGGFKSLRSHVKAAKDGGCEPVWRDGGDEEEERQLAEVQLNRQRLWEEEQQLNALRSAVVREQKALQERERALQLDEIALEATQERTALKERQLDDRIAEIARLELRLHEALLQYSAGPPQQVHFNEENNFEHREAQLVLQEQELALLRERVEQREKQLVTKERILRDKEAELSACQLKYESIKEEMASTTTFSKQQNQNAAIREAEFETKQRAWEEMYEQQRIRMEHQKAQLERWTSELFAREANIAKVESNLASQEAAIRAHELALDRVEQRCTMVQQQNEQSAMGVEDFRTQCLVLVGQKLDEVSIQIETTTQERLSFQEAEARLQQRENRLRVLAKEVELQHQANLRKQTELDAELCNARTKAPAEMPPGNKPQPAVVSTEKANPRRKSLTKKANSTSAIRQ